MSTAIGNEKHLIKRYEVELFNRDFEDCISRRLVRTLSDEETAALTGLVKNLSHHGVEKQTSTTIALRVVSNFNLDSNHRGVSYNDILPKAPNSLVSLQRLVQRRGR